MEWGIVMAFPTVLAMLVLVFAESPEGSYQTFGRAVLNPPARDITDPVEVRKAA
jgi:hypothetical protein